MPLGSPSVVEQSLVLKPDVEVMEQQDSKVSPQGNSRDAVSMNEDSCSSNENIADTDNAAQGCSSEVEQEQQVRIGLKFVTSVLFLLKSYSLLYVFSSGPSVWR